MNRHTKIALWTLFILGVLIILPRFIKFDLAETFTFDFDNNPLKKIVKKHINENEGNFAVYIESFGSKETYAFNEGIKFPAASLYKVVLMAAVYKDIEDGKLKEDKVLVAKKSHLTDVLGAVDFGYEEAEEQISYSVEQSLKRVAEISDNFAAIMLTDALLDKGKPSSPREKLTNMAKSLGIEATTFEKDELIQTSAYDMGTYFKKLYKQSLLSDDSKGEVISTKSAKKILELLSGSKLNNRIPAKLPKEVKVVHKTGELARIRHDAGIVYLSPAGPDYVIVLMSKEIKNEDKTVGIMADLSKEVYEYFKEKQ